MLVSAETPPTGDVIVEPFDNQNLISEIINSTVSNGIMTLNLDPGKWVWGNRTPPTSPGMRSYPGFAFNDKGIGVLFGGWDGSGDNGETWIFNVTANTWTQLFPPTSPGGRQAAKMVYDSNNEVFILYGGLGPGALSDTWEFDLNTWTNRNPVSPPEAFYDYAMEFSNGVVLLFGGNGDAGWSDKLWEYNYVTNTWTNKNPPLRPPARNYPGFACNPDVCVLFGGTTSSTPMPGTWEYTYSTNSWVETTPASSPPARYKHEMVYDIKQDKFLIMHGDVGAVWDDDVWAYDADLNTWEELFPEGESVGQFGGFGAEYVEKLNATVVYGGWDDLVGLRPDETLVLRYDPIAQSSRIKSTNLLTGTPTDSIDSFDASFTSLDGESFYEVQFSQDGINWVDSSGVSDSWDYRTTESVDLSGLSWSGENFYYRLKLLGDGTISPELDWVAVYYSKLNTPPVVTPPTFNDTIYWWYSDVNASSVIRDDDLDLSFVTFRWYINDVYGASSGKSNQANGTNSSSLLSSTALNRGDYVNVSVDANDGEDAGLLVWSETIQICDCDAADECCSPDNCRWLPLNSDPKWHPDDTDGFCVGTEGAMEVSQILTRDYFCNASNQVDYTNTTIATCGLCNDCEDNSLVCKGYFEGEACGTGSCPDSFCRDDENITFGTDCTQTCFIGICQACTCPEIPVDCTNCDCSCGDFNLDNEIGFCHDTKNNDCDIWTDKEEYECNNFPDQPINPSPENRANGVSLEPILSVTVNDPDLDNLNVSFYNGYTGEVLGEVKNIASGGIASLPLTGLEKGTIYKWYAKAKDKFGDTNQSETFSFLTTFGKTIWESPTCKARERVIFNNYGNNVLSDFPTLIKLNADFNYTATDINEIRFFDNQFLNHEIITWNPGGESLIWVNVPSILSSKNDLIYIYYNCTDTYGENKDLTWNDNFKLVSHYQTDLTDSSGNVNSAGGLPVYENGIIGSAANISSVLTIPASASLNLRGEVTLEVWVRKTVDNSPPKILIGKGRSIYQLEQKGNEVVAFINNQNISTELNSGWNYIAATYNANTLKLYLDGIIKDQKLIGSVIPANLIPLEIGNGVTGLFDEIRVSSIARDSDYFKSNFNTAIDNFEWYGEQENEEIFNITLLSPVNGDETIPPTVVSLSVLVENGYAIFGNVSFYDSSDGSLIGYVEDVGDGQTASVDWDLSDVKTPHSWYVIVSHPIQNVISETFNFITQGYRISTLPNLVTTTLVGSPIIDPTTTYLYGEHNVMFSYNGAEVGNTTISFYANRDLSEAVIKSEPGKSMIYFNRVSYPFVGDNFSLQVPIGNDIGAIYLCKQATTFEEVSRNCANVELLTNQVSQGGFYSFKIENGGALEEAEPTRVTINNPIEESLVPPTSIVLNVTITNVAEQVMWVRFYDKNEDLIDQDFLVPNGAYANVTWEIPIANNLYEWRLTVSSEMDPGFQTRFYNFSTEGYSIEELPEGLSLTLMEDRTKNLEINSVYGPQNVLLLDSGNPIANFTVDFYNQDVNLSEIIGISNPAESKSLLSINVTDYPEVSNSFTLHVPAGSETGSVILCPNAKSIEEISPTCPGVKLIEHLTSKDGYYLIPISGTGGEEIPEVEYATLANKEASYGMKLSPIGSKIKGIVNDQEVDYEFTGKEEWKQYAIKYNGSAISLYINGQQVISQDYTGVIDANTAELFIGNFLDGQIDEVKLFNSAITDSELEKLYQEGVNQRQEGVDYDVTVRAENWSARVWVSNNYELSSPYDSNGIWVDKPCPSNGCGVGFCGLSEYGEYNYSNSCELTCFTSADSLEGCEICNDFNWSDDAQDCCGDQGIMDNFCIIGSNSCVEGIFFENHCEDYTTNCDEEDLDCNGTCPSCGLDISLNDRSTRYLKDSDSDMLSWTFRARGSKDYEYELMPVYTPQIPYNKVTVRGPVNKLIFDHTEGITTLYAKEKDEENIIQPMDYE